MSSPIRIKTKLIPAEARSKDLKNTGVVGHYSSGGSSTSTGAQVQESIEIVASGEDRQLKDNNVLSSLRTIKEILARIISNTEEATDENTYSAAKVNSMVEAIDEAISGKLSKNKPDSTDFLQKFLGGAEFGEFIDSMSHGKGAGIDEHGNAQFESVEVRSSFKVLELIYNRLQAVESDFVFTASGTIEKVEKISIGYRLTFRKRHENDFAAFHKGDVLRSVVNDLEGGEGYTSWMRIVDINNNVADVSLYPPSETPAGQNHPPTELMVLQHWGNAINKERQSTWYLSSQEGRIVFLDGVTKPILEDHNYSSFWGKPPQLKQFEGQPINYNQPYFYSRGTILQDIIRLDYNGVPQVDIKDYGLWYDGFMGTSGANAPYVQSDVWHNGVKWRCVRDTLSEPSISNTDWVVLTGDTELRMELLSERGFVYLDTNVNDLVTSVVRLGQLDVTSKVLPSDWSWTRNTGNADLDALWNEQHKGLTNKLELKQSDVQDAEGIISITCTAYYRTESRVMKIENSIDL